MELRFVVTTTVVFTVDVLFFAGAFEMGNCTDYKRQTVAAGERFTPLGYDACTTCTCEHGRPEMCLSMLCSPPKECKNLIPLDDKCCEFECFDSSGKVTPSNVTVSDAKDLDSLNATNLGLRLVASTITSFLILALLLFMIHRLRQRRLLLMIRRINGSQVVGIPYGSRRYSLGDDGSVGGYPAVGGGHDHVAFPPYDDPPPPYTFWKPPESYFPQEEAPPPYEASSNNNNATRNHNAINDGSGYRLQQVTASSVPPPPVGGLPAYPVHHYVQPLGGGYGCSQFANSPSSHNGLIPSLTQVSLRTNNFQINDLDQEPAGGSQRHFVPVHDLNVVGSLTSLNELNEVGVSTTTTTTNNADGNVHVLRSDAVYGDHVAAGMLPPLTPNVVGGSSAANDGGGTSVPPSSKWEESANLERRDVAAPGAASASKCHSCSDVVDCWHERRRRDVKCRSLMQQPEVQFCPDPTRWSPADASETSSSSSPTFERTTMSPTSSDSSSIDYSSYGVRHVVPATSGGAIKQPCCRKTSLPSQLSTAAAATTTQSSHQNVSPLPKSSSSSLDRTLDTIRLKMSLKRKSGRPGKLRRLLTGGRNSTGDLPATSKRHDAPTASTSDDGGAIPLVMSSSLPCGTGTIEDDEEEQEQQQANFRTPRILYVSDGDVSFRSKDTVEVPRSQVDSCGGGSIYHHNHHHHHHRGVRPRSYDFADLQSAAAVGGLSTSTAIKEESTSASLDVTTTTTTTHSDNPATTTADCCCSLSSDRLGSSLDSFACTCSSRASFGSISTPSREAPASPLCSPVLSTAGCEGEDRDGGDSSPDMVASPQPPTTGSLERFPAAAASKCHAPALARTGTAATLLARSGSVCSETGEQRHRKIVARQQPPPLPSATDDNVSSGNVTSNFEPSGHHHVPEKTTKVGSSTDVVGSSSGTTTHFRLALTGILKGNSHESYI